ncbi:MAG TPA: hypothetical protein VG936_05110 [Lacunisphaera sp.]|nr:hypothetical protein [Lacunisphaera sp.]
MQRSLHSPAFFRFGLIAVVAALLARNARAQDNTDPFVYLRGGAGDQQMASSYDRGMTQGPVSWNYLTGNSFWPDLFFPLETLQAGPLPPVLGETWPEPDGSGFGLGSETGLDGETFFVGFAILAGRGGLSDDESKRIVSYQQARQQLLDEIRAKLAELADAPPAARAAGLSTLAAQQTIRLEALAREEEDIRSELAWVGPKFGRALAFGAAAGQAESPRLLFAANFYDGLSIEQRMLLAEIAHPEASAFETIAGGPPAAGDIVLFLPATSRVHLPAGMSPELAEKVRVFGREKANLADELRQTVLRDDYILSSTRTHRLEALAAAQAPRFAALEARAEEIRRELANLGFRGHPDELDLPMELTQRVGSFYARKMHVRRELLTELRTLRREHPGVGFEFNLTDRGDGLQIVQTGKDAQAAAAVAKFNASQAPLYAGFIQESESLRREIEQYLRHNPGRSNRSVDQLAADFVRAYAARRTAEQYRDYGRAVLEPGLSFAQRRLLFTAALWPAKQPAAKPQP